MTKLLSLLYAHLYRISALLWDFGLQPMMKLTSMLLLTCLKSTWTLSKNLRQLKRWCSVAKHSKNCNQASLWWKNRIFTKEYVKRQLNNLIENSNLLFILSAQIWNSPTKVKVKYCTLNKSKNSQKKIHLLLLS